MTFKVLQSIKGQVAVENLGLILPHEHLFTDLRGPFAEGYAEADPEAVARVMTPYLEKAEAVGVSALVECSTVGVGRNIEVLKKLASITPIHIIAPTGVYREAFMPEHLMNLSVDALAKLWIRELTEGMEGIEARAGFIKLAMSDEEPTPVEIRNLKAAAVASKETGAVIASHTASWEVARQEMEVLEAEGLDLSRFIWVHANLEPDPAKHIEAATRGAYVEFDAIGAEWQDQDSMLEYTMNLTNAGYGDRILLSHDAGWYDPSQSDGKPEETGIRGYTTLVEKFIPLLRSHAMTDSQIELITQDNPSRAFMLEGVGA